MSDVYVRRERDGEIVFRGDLHDAVAEARRGATHGGSHTVAKRNIFGSEIVFERYPEADRQWEALQRLGLVPDDH